MLPEDEIYNLCIHVPRYPYCILATKIHNGVYGNVIEESIFFSNIWWRDCQLDKYKVSCAL